MDRKVNGNSCKCQIEGGFTLVELMITVLLSMLIMGALASVYVNHQNNTIAQDQVTELQQNLRAAIYLIEHDIRMAGYDPLNIAGASITTATANNLVFTKVENSDGVDNDGDTTIDEDDELTTVSYYLFDSLGDGDMELGRKLNTSNVDAVAENIDAIEFYYTLDDGTQTLAPADLSEIRAVTLSILARAGREDNKYSNTQTYVPGSGSAIWDINDSDDGTGNPPNDNFRRRLLVTTVQFRNMGL